MSESKPSYLLPIVGAVVVAAGGAGAYYFFSGRGGAPSIPGASQVSGAAALIPQQALLTVSVSNDEATFAKLNALLPPEVQKSYAASTENFSKLLAEGGVDLDQDVRPWAGREIVVAVLPPSPAASARPRYIPVASNGSIPLVQVPEASPTPAATVTTPNVLVVVEVKDQAGLTAFANKFKSREGAKSSEADYKGVQIASVTREGNSVSTAVVGNYLVFAPQPQAVQLAVDTFQGQPSLASSLSSNDLQLANPLVRVFVPNFAKAIPQLAALNPGADAIPAETLKSLEQVESLHFGIGADDNGLRLKVLGRLNPSVDVGQIQNSSHQILTQLPAETFAVTTGINLNAYWQRFVTEASKDPELKKAIDGLREQAKSSPLALDLDQDVFSWMDREFAIGAIAAKPEGILSQTQGIAPVVLFQTGNRSAAEALLKKLDEFVTQNGGTVEKRDVNGVAVTDWSAPGAPGTIASHGWHREDTFFITLAPATGLFVPKPAATLADAAAFKAATGTIPSQSIGYFYLDGERTWQVLNTVLPAEAKAAFTPEGQAFVKSVRGLGVTASYRDKLTSELEVFLAIAPSKN